MMKSFLSLIAVLVLSVSIFAENDTGNLPATTPVAKKAKVDNTPQITVNFSKKLGSIKPMNAGNNGPKRPLPGKTDGNFDTYKMLNIPYARVHDANISPTYGAPNTIDVWAIFKDFKADPNDPASYDFRATDQYLKTIAQAGTEPFFRLGGRIEHGSVKRFTQVPTDFHKFAVICEHIIRHCTGDWANGLNMKITYWEIWNEPDLDADDAPNKRCWQGTAEQFREMFCITFKHLKSCFPNLKIGGPASCSSINQRGLERWADKLFEKMEQEGVKLDFYSWHRYSNTTTWVFDSVREVRKYLDSHGQPQAESILNEWNYVRRFLNKTWNWDYTLEQEAGMKGAAFVLSVMLGCQKLPLDMLMYYDFRDNTRMNGLWNRETYNIQKPWFAFFMFDKLARLGTEVESTSNNPMIEVVGATDAKGRKAVVIASFTDDDYNQTKRSLKITLKGISAEEKKHLSVRLLDKTMDCQEIPFYWEKDTIRFTTGFNPCFGLLIQTH